MITVTKRINKEVAHASTFPDDLLAKVCVEVAGGGYSPKQVVNAMTLQFEVEQTGTGKLGKFTITKE